MRRMKSFRVLLVFLAGVVFILFSGCGVSEYEFTEWNGSFIINDSTAGIIGWKYEEKVSTNSFVPSKYGDVRQNYYHYNFNTGKLSKIKTLRDNEGYVIDFYNVVYNHPYIYFCSKTDSKCIGIYNIETKENRIFKDGYKPLCASSDNRYMGFKYTSRVNYDYGIYDVSSDSIVWSSSIYIPVYINNDSNFISLGPHYLVEMYFYLQNYDNEIIDTLSKDTFGSKIHNATNDITVFRNDSGYFYMNNAEMIEGVFEPRKIENLDSCGTGHVSVEYKKAAYSAHDEIRYIDFGNNREEEVLFDRKKEER